MTRAYGNRMGLMADAPNFPAAWDQVVGAGIANIYSRTPALIASTVATLDERSGGRIILGLGPSGANVIEHWHGVPSKNRCGAHANMSRSSE